MANRVDVRKLLFMDNETFFTSHLRLEASFQAGLVSIDIVGHGKLKGGNKQIADTREALEAIVKSQILDSPATCLPWQGDGGVVVFDVSAGGDDMVMFADRVRHLGPFLNRARGNLNKLPHQQTLTLRIVCHSGVLFNKGFADRLGGDAFNLLAKHEREIQEPGYVVITDQVHRTLTGSVQRRFKPHETPHPEMGQTYVLDQIALCSIESNDMESNQLRDWITAALQREKYDRLLYFAYTNERLHNFLGHQLKGIEIEVMILVRNWLTEREEEQEYNLIAEHNETDIQTLAPRPWLKSTFIKAIAESIEEANLPAQRKVEMRFYDTAPIFKGVILVKDKGASCAHIGFCKWLEQPVEGSPYKADQWPALILDGKDRVQAKLIDYIQSRFQELWMRGLTFKEVSDEDQIRQDTKPAVIGRVWALDKCPYLIVYPHRRVKGRPFPVVALEDIMAVREIETFLRSHRVKVELLSIELPDRIKGDWFPPDATQKIEQWRGHLVYICSRSIPPSIQQYLQEAGLPYQFGGIGTNRTSLLDLEAQIRLKSPTRLNPPKPKDLSLVARFKRPRAMGQAYIVAGIRGMGTWGAATYLTQVTNIRELGDKVSGQSQFAAVVETEFDPNRHQIIDSHLHISPKYF